MEEPAENPDVIKHETVKRPMNAFLIFCKRHRGLVHEKNPSLDNRSVTRILGDLWANLGPDEKYMYTDLAKQYKEAFLKANPDYKWYNPEKHAAQVMTSGGNKPGRPSAGSLAISQSLVLTSTGISPGKLADPSNMGGLSMLLMAGQQTLTSAQSVSTTDPQTMSAQPPITRGLTTTDQRATELTRGRNTSSNEEFSSWPTLMPSLKKMESETEIKTSDGCAGRKLIKTEEGESIPSHKNSTGWPTDQSHRPDSFQSSCMESRPALIEIDRSEGVATRCDPIKTERSPDRKDQVSRVSSDQTTNGDRVATWGVIRNPSDVITKPDVTGQSSFPLFGSVATSPLETDRAKIPFIGHPLTYLFGQPTQKSTSQQRLKILLPTGMPTVSTALTDHTSVTKGPEFFEIGPNSEHPVLARSPGTAEKSKVDGQGRGELRKFVVEKVIEAAYSKGQECEAGFQSFPKTKKQLAVDKLSSSNRSLTPPHNGNLEQRGECAVSRSISVPSEGAGSFKEIGERSGGSNAPEINGDVSAMTIGEINEKLIMKVVQEEDATSISDSPIGESRLPLKLQKKYKRTDGVGRSISSSASIGESSPDYRSCSSSVLDLEASINSIAPILNDRTRLMEKSGVATAGSQKVNIFMNSNLLSAYPEFLRSGSLLGGGERRQMGSTAVGPIAGSIPSPKNSMGVSKLIETLIQESFALHGPDTTKPPTFPTPQQQTTSSIITPDEGNRTRPAPDSYLIHHPLSHINKTLDGAKALKRKRNKRPELSDPSPDVTPQTQSLEKPDIKEGDAASRTEGVDAPANPLDGAVRSPKRPRELAESDEACSHVPSADSELYKTSGAWHLIDNILNERAIDLNGGRSREEINNNSREKAMIGVDHEGMASSNKALRKSKRANQGLRYKELMSKGVLYASRKSMDCNNLIEDNRDNMDATNEDEGNDLFGVSETMLPRRRCHADSTSIDMETEVGRRYKSGDFDLEAHIACLPACQIEVTDRKSAGKIKSRSHSQSAATTSVSFVRLPHHKRIDLKSDEIKNGNGLSLEEISFCKLRRLSRLSAAYRKNLRCLFGSARRKARGYCIFQLLPIAAYHAIIVQPVTRETNPDEHAVSSPMATLTVISASDDVSSFGYQVAAEDEALDAQKREMHSSFDILAAAAAVSSSGD